MHITLNGEAYSLSSPITVTELLAQLELDVRKVAIERNKELVVRSTFDTIMVEENDAIEIVHFIGGG